MTDEEKQNWGDKIKDKKTGHECYLNPERGKKIGEKNSKIIIQYTLDGEFIKEWKSVSEAAKHTNTNIGSISRVTHGTLNKAGGYKWKYK